MDRRRGYQLKPIRQTESIRWWVVLAFAKVGFNAIDEGLFRTWDHEINLIKVRAEKGRRNVVTGRTSFSVANLTRAGKSAILSATLMTF